MLLAVCSCFVTNAQIEPERIKYWIGSGQDTAYLAVNYQDAYDMNAYIWGYLFDGDKTGKDLLLDVGSEEVNLFTKVTTEIDSIAKSAYTYGTNSESSSWNAFTSDISLGTWNSGGINDNLSNGVVFGVAFHADETVEGDVSHPGNAVVYGESPTFHDESISKVKYFVGEGDKQTVAIFDFKNSNYSKSLAFGVHYNEGETLLDVLTTLQNEYEAFSFDAGTYLNSITFDTLTTTSWWGYTANNLLDEVGSYTTSALGVVTLEEDMFYAFNQGAGSPAKLRPVFSPAANELGSNAIALGDERILSWATGVTVNRGLIQFDDESVVDMGSNLATSGDESLVIGEAAGTSADVLSLGDNGTAVLTFENPITDGEGYDFAVFENGFSHTFLELAFVEVSSDGENYYRFPSYSATSVTEQVGQWGALDSKNIHNLAGSFMQGYGTPFDLAELEGVDGLDVTTITHVKLIDVVGTIDPEYASRDSYGNIINDNYPTAFATGGFDLDGVAVLNEKEVVNGDVSSVYASDLLDLTVFPNPATNVVNFQLRKAGEVTLYSLNGNKVFTGSLPEGSHTFTKESLNVTTGMYFVQIEGESESVTKLIIK